MDKQQQQTTESTKEIIAKLEQEIATREEQLKAQDKIIEECMNKLRDIENNVDTDIPQLSRRIHKIEKLIIENLIDKNTKNYERSQDNEEQKQFNSQGKYSNSAIIIKNISKKISTYKLKELLNTELIKENDLPIFCKQTRQINTLTIQSDTDNNTEKLLERIEKIPNISEIVELTYNLQKHSRIIITGIPSMIPTDDIINYLKDRSTDKNLTILKIIQREKSTSYHMVLNLEVNAAKELLAQKSISIGLNNCSIRIYRPILRCGNCQLYGHTKTNCRRNSICAKCAMGHQTLNCPYITDPSQHRCTNCYDQENYRKHTADSSLCPIFQSQLADRRYR